MTPGEILVTLLVGHPLPAEMVDDRIFARSLGLEQAWLKSALATVQAPVSVPSSRGSTCTASPSSTAGLSIFPMSAIRQPRLWSAPCERELEAAPPSSATRSADPARAFSPRWRVVFSPHGPRDAQRALATGGGAGRAS